MCVRSKNSKGRSYTQLEPRKQVIVFLDRVTPGHEEAQHPLKRAK